MNLETNYGYETPELEISFTNPNLGIEDIYVSHPRGQVRIIRYPRPSEAQSQIRDILIAKNLIVGKLRSEVDEFEQHFLVPHETTPVNNYLTNRNGNKIAYQLGKLLNNLANIDDHIYILSGDLNKFVAIYDHRSESLALKFTPGVELMINRYVGNVNQETMTKYYSDQLNKLSQNPDLLAQFKGGYLDRD